MAPLVRVAFLPVTPMLVPQIATGAAHELEPLRAAARSAVDWAMTGARHAAVVLPDETATVGGSSLAGFGLDVGAGPPAPLPLAIARWLLGDRSATAMPAGSLELSGFDAVLVMGDGSASRTEKAPGSLHPAAHTFDDAVITALTAGDPQSLAGLDPSLGVEVKAEGTPAWRSIGAAVASVDEAHVDYGDDPYGVLYIVARWRARLAVQA